MLKRGLILLFLLLVPGVFAAVSLTYNFNENNVLFDTYRCQGNCNNLNIIDSHNISGNSLVYSYQNPGSYFYVAYKNCFFPLANEAPISQDIDGMGVDLELTKRQGCSASVNSAILLQGSYGAGRNITITTIVTSPFLREDFSRPGFLDGLPSGRYDFFNTIVNTKLYVNNNLISEKNETFFISQEKQINFSWTPASNGSYTIRVVSSVPDCKCIDSQLYERTINISIGNQSSSNQQASQPIYQSFQINVVNDNNSAQENLPSASSAGCGSMDGCNTRCFEGDSDCTCDIQSGFICEENELCKGRLLKNWGNRICCSMKCEKEGINLSNVINLLNVKNKSEEGNITNNSLDVEIKNLIGNKQYPLALMIAIFLIGIAFGVIFGMDKTRNAISDFAKKEIETLEEEGKMGVEFFKKEKGVISEKLKNKKKENVKPQKKIQTITPLLSNIMESLTDDENKVIMKIIENEGLSKEELKLKTGFSKEKFDYCLLKLVRRQLVNLRREEINPKIYINDWLK